MDRATILTDRFDRALLYATHVHGGQVRKGTSTPYVGHSSRLHTAKVLRLSFDLPIVVEIVDTEAKINEFLPTLDRMMASGLITLEKVQVLQYGAEGLRERAGSV